MTVDHREISLEQNIEESLERGGWLVVSPSEFDAKLGLFPSELVSFIRDTQPDEWKRLCGIAGTDDRAARLLCERVAKKIDDENAVAVLRHGVIERGIRFTLMYRRPAHDLSEEVMRLYGANRCAIVRQFKYDESGNEIDLALALNGIPIATAELKNPLSGQDVRDAMRQYRTTRDGANVTLGARCLVHFAIDPNEAHFTTRLKGSKTRFFPFNRGSETDGTGGAGNYADPEGSYRTAYVWRDVWQRDSWIDIVARFIHIEAGRPPTIIFPRYHQLEVVRRLLADARENGAGHSYLVQHSAGSGKSNSIAWLAHGLYALQREGDELAFDKVIVITDRRVLDKQLQGTIFQFEHRHGVVEKINAGVKSKQLGEALAGSEARIIISTVQTFPALLRKIEEENTKLERGRKYAVIIDEAHSSQTGETATALKQVLGELEEDDGDVDAIARMVAARGRQPNMSFFAFTATPKARTLAQFGRRGADGLDHPFHLYSMRQAIEEGFIVDVLDGYMTYDVYYRLQAPPDREDLEMDQRKTASAARRFAELHPHMLGQKAEIVVEHFREHVADRLNGTAKAMIVTDSRLQAVKFRLAIDKYIADKGYGDDVRALVAFSGEVKDEDGNVYTEPQMNGFAESEVPKRFAADYQILIVAEKYQTGFDQPKLCAMYVNKPLKDVAAVQTLSRLNRTHPGKDRVFVLDFVNTADDIADAFDDYYAKTTAEPPEANLLFDAADRLHRYDVLRQDEIDAYAKLLYENSGSKLHDKLYALTAPAVERFRLMDEDEQEAFRDAARTYQRAYAFLSQVVPWVGVDEEKLYAFVRGLLPQIPDEGDAGGDVDLNGVELTHFRVQQNAEEKIRLGGSSDPLRPFSGDGTGGAGDEHLDTLAQIIERLNERYGLALSDSDRLLGVEHPMRRLLGDSRIVAQARENDLETFSLVANDDLQRVWLETKDQAEDLFLKIMTHPDLKSALTEHILGAVHAQAREGQS